MKDRLHDPKDDGTTGWGYLTLYKTGGLCGPWLDCIHTTTGYMRTVTLDLTCGNGGSVTRDWSRGSIWGLELQQAIRHAQNGTPQIVHGNEINKEAFASLTHKTAKALGSNEEIVRISETEWKAPNLEVQLYRRNSRAVALREYGAGDLVIVVIDGNSIDMSAKATNQDELVGLTQRGASVFMFLTMKTQTPARMLPWEDGRVHWRRLRDTLHLVAVPSLGLKDTLYFVHRDKGHWVWAMTVLPEWVERISASAETKRSSLKHIPRQVGGNRNGELMIDVLSEQRHSRFVQMLWRASTVTKSEEAQSQARKMRDSYTAVKSHITMGHNVKEIQ